MKSRRILYLQFGNPAHYPPLERSSRLLADRGWDVVMLGTGVFGHGILKSAAHPRIRVKNFTRVAGRRKAGLLLQYLILLVWSVCWTCFWRPAWIYASDPLVLPALWIVRKFTGAHIVYHEHDSPNRTWSHSRFMRTVLACRGTLGKSVELCIVPQQERLINFLKETRRRGLTLCVWNCPRRDEVNGFASDENNRLILYYHGSINRSRLPPELIVAASRFNGAIILQIAGYETAGSTGYVQELMHLAAENGVPNILEFRGAIPLHSDLMLNASKANVGLSLMPNLADDINLRHMVGASNKPFDYMACGLPLLVTNLPEWTLTFVEPGYARACNPNDADSIEAELRWYYEHPFRRREMGQACIEKIRRDWNYESFFAPALAYIESNP